MQLYADTLQIEHQPTSMLITLEGVEISNVLENYTREELLEELTTEELLDEVRRREQEANDDPSNIWERK